MARGSGGNVHFLGCGIAAFALGEETKKFAALVGSPTGAEAAEEYQTNYSESRVNSFRLGVTRKGREKKIIVLAASMDGRAAAEATYQHLSAGYEELLRASADYYRKYL